MVTSKRKSKAWTDEFSKNFGTKVAYRRRKIEEKEARTLQEDGLLELERKRNNENQ